MSMRSGSPDHRSRIRRTPPDGASPDFGADEANFGGLLEDATQGPENNTGTNVATVRSNQGNLSPSNVPTAIHHYAAELVSAATAGTLESGSHASTFEVQGMQTLEESFQELPLLVQRFVERLWERRDNFPLFGEQFGRFVDKQVLNEEGASLGTYGEFLISWMRGKLINMPIPNQGERVINGWLIDKLVRDSAVSYPSVRCYHPEIGVEYTFLFSEVLKYNLSL